MSVFKIKATIFGGDKCESFITPISLKDQPYIVKLIRRLAYKNNVQVPLFGRSKTLYLDVNVVSKKVTKDQSMKVKFEIGDKIEFFEVKGGLKLRRRGVKIERDIPDDY